MKQFCAAILLALSLAFNSSYAENDLASLSAELESVAGNALSEMAMEVAIKINLSGTQSMLVQKMVTEALLITLAIDAEKNKANLQESIERFDNILIGFQNDDEELKITQTHSKKVLAQMEKLAESWDTFKTIVGKIGDDSAANKTLMSEMQTARLPLLQESEKLGSMFGAYCGENLSELATIIHLAGKQRMLTQQMSAELLLLAQNEKSDEVKATYKTQLEKIAQQFDDTLTSLVKGNKQQKIPATSDQAILDQLDKVRTQWEKVKPILEVADTDKATLQKVVDMDLALLATMSKAAEMYIR